MPTFGLPHAGGEFDRTSLFSGMSHSTPARSVQLSHNPSVHVYHSLRMTVEQSSAPWLRAFLEQDGLGSLVEAVEQLSSTQFTGFSDAILLLDCLACVRSVLNTSLGMTHFLNSDIYMRKLVKGLSTGSTLSKKHVFELMTAVCVYSSLGYQKTVDALQHYQKSTDQASMFSVIIAEMKFSDTALYRTALMSLLNTIINSTEDIRTRCALRNELIAMQLLDMMHHFRREEKDADLAIQLEAFSIAKHRDDLELAQSYKLNPSSHQDLFYAIYREVLGTPECGTFLSLLQDLYLMTSSNSHSDHLWRAVGKAAHHISSLSSKAEADHFTANLQEMTRPYRPTHADGHEVFNEGVVVSGGPGICRLDRKDSGISVGSGRSVTSIQSFQRQGSGRTSGSKSLRRSGRMTRIAEDEVRGQSNGVGARPTGSHRNLKWIKVPKSKVKKEVSVWGQGTENRLRPDYCGLDQEFPEAIRLQDADDEVELLTGVQSVAVNVYLSRMDMSPEELVGYLEDGDDARVSLSGLRYLMAVLPSHDEMQQLRAYRGERYDLGQAEQFLLLLTDLPDYRTLLAGLLFKAEFGPRYQKLKTAFSAMTKAARDILHHQGLKDFLFLLLDSGNYLNQGSIFGSAAGLRLSSLARVSDLRGQTPGTSLLDHLVRVADAQSEEVTLFAADIPHLSVAASHDLEELKTEVTALSTEMRRVLGLLAVAHPSIKATFDFFIEDVKQDLQQLQDAICQLRSLSQQMALYLCEDEADFRLHTALKQVHNLCEAVKRSTKDGIYGRQQAARAEKRKAEMKQAESNVAGVFSKQAGAGCSLLVPQREKIVDCLLREVHSGQVEGHCGDALTTPDLEWDPLTVSGIAPASPLQGGEDSLGLSALQEEDGDLGTFYPCLPDRIEDVISHQYRKGHQVASSSFLAPENGSRKKACGLLASPEEFSLDRIEPRVCRPGLTASDPRPGAGHVPATSHRRTVSDPNQSQHVDKKWIEYEKQQITNKQTKKAVESELTVASLGLEKNGQALSKEDILDLSDHVDKENAAPPSKEKKKKRSSFGLLKKISRALKPRNSDIIPKAEIVPKKLAVRPTNLPLNSGKENVPAAPPKEQAVRCRQQGVTSRHQVTTSKQRLTTSRQQRLTSRQQAMTSLEENITAVEKVQEEPLYKIVIYQKYHSEC